MKDQLVRAMTKDGFVNAVAVTTTGIVERARQIHKTPPQRPSGGFSRLPP